VHAAQSWLAGPLEKSHLSLEALQVHCLLLLARQVLSIGGDIIWTSAGALMNQAFHMGLHHDPSNLPGIDLLRSEIRRRLWATILDFVLQSALDTALPPRITLHDFDVAAPSNVDDADLDASVMVASRGDVYTDTTVQRLLLQSVPQRLQALQLLNGLNAKLYYPEVLSIGQSIIDACESSGTTMKKHDVPAFQCNLLDFLQRRFILPLHCPFANRTRGDPLFHFSLKCSLDAAASIIMPSADAKFSRLMAIAGGMFREGLRYAAVTVGLEVLSHALAKDRLSGLVAATERQVLRDLTSKLIDQSMERIRRGETNVKSPLFLRMVLAQAQATEDGIPCRLVMAQAARDSLRETHEILQAKKEAMTPESHLDAAGVSTSPFGDVDDLDFDIDFDFFMPEITF
jgi:hypothetical protein